MKLPINHIIWFAIRIVIILFFTIPSIQGAWTNAHSSLLGLPPANVAIFFGFFLFLSGIWQMRWILKQMIKGKQKSNEPIVFYKPSWHLNPFLKNEAYPFFHMLSMAFLISGLTGMGRYWLLPSVNSSALVMPTFLIACSVSWLSGMYINIIMNKDKFRAARQ